MVPSGACVFACARRRARTAMDPSLSGRRHAHGRASAAQKWSSPFAQPHSSHSAGASPRADRRDGACLDTLDLSARPTQNAHARDSIEGSVPDGPCRAPGERFVKVALLCLVRAYRWLRPALGPPRCRFQPTCSQYALEAIEVHGSLRGSYMAAARILKCHPFHTGGFDPVPDRPLGS